MESQRRDDQPVLTYPVTTASSGRPVIGYPVSQFQLPVTAAAAARTTQRIGNPSTCKTVKKATKVLIRILVPLFILSVAVVMFVAASSAPKLPNVALTSVSATARNASHDRFTADFDASFLVVNRAKKGMDFDHLTAYAFEAEAAGHIAPFWLRSGEGKTVSFRINGVSNRVDDWEVKFGVTANVWYRGKTWSDRKIPIMVSCESVKVPFPYNASSSASESQTQTVNVGENSGFCQTDGQWKEDASTFTRIGICFLLAFIIITVILFMLVIYS